MASPQYAIANDGSRRSASRNASMASSYSKLWRSSTPRMKCGCAAGAPEVGKEMWPRPRRELGAWARRHRGDASHRENRPPRHRATEIQDCSLRLCASVADSLCVLSVSVANSVQASEREPEHDLGDPHEPCLDRRLAEVRVAECARASQRADVDAIEQ